MNQLRQFAIVLVYFSLAILPTVSRADDPLDAFPTAENTAEDRVKKLSEVELQAITLPADGNQIVLSITYLPLADSQQPDALPTEPLLRVFADGRIDCGSLLLAHKERAKDSLSKSELQWLLHLATNECQILTRSTKAISDNYKSRRRRPADPGEPAREIRYHLALLSGKNELVIPEMALVLRPLRAEMKLPAFASFHHYANFLVARAFMGTEKERETILKAVNEKMKSTHDTLPPFRIDHLGAALRGLPNVELSVVFQQEIPLGRAKYKRVTATFIQRDQGAEPEIKLNVLEYTRYAEARGNK